MQNINLSRKLFDLEELSSDDSAESVIYISSDEEEEDTDPCNSDWSSDTEAMISRIEREVRSRLIPIADWLWPRRN